MPSIKDQHTVKAIARAFVGNGHKRGEALIEAGYKPRYANSGHCAKIYDRIEVKEAIEGYEADIRVDTAMTVERVQGMYLAARDLAITNNQPSAAVSAITGIARLYGMDKDNQTNTEAPTALTPEQAEQANRAANVVLSDNMKGTA
jgi:hypothetical protein